MRKLGLGVLLALLTALAGGWPARPAAAQCPSISFANGGIPGAPSARSASQQLTASVDCTSAVPNLGAMATMLACTVVPFTNMANIFIMASGPGMYTTAESPFSDASCSFACTCGTIIVRISDGLPVELLGFSVDDELSDGIEGASGEDSGSETVDPEGD